MPVAVPAVIGIAAISAGCRTTTISGSTAAGRGTPARRSRHPREGHRERPTPGFLPLPVHPGGAAGATGSDPDAGARAGLDHLFGHFRRAGASPTATLPVAALIVHPGSRASLGRDRQHPLHRRHHSAGGEPARRKLHAGPDGQVLWWALAPAPASGGNGTLIGASAIVKYGSRAFAGSDGKAHPFDESRPSARARRADAS